MNNYPNRYDNMINIERPRQKHPMSELNRAAQFAAFAALTGYGEIINDTSLKNDEAIYKIDHNIYE